MKRALYLFLVSIFVFSLAHPALAKEKNKEVKKAAATPDNAATVYMKNGNAMTCTIKKETPKQVTVLWEGMEMTLERAEIQKIEKGAAIAEGGGLILENNASKAKDAQSYKNNPVIKLTSGQVLDAKISAANAKIVTLANDLGDGAFAYVDTPREKIESLEFRPVANEQSRKVEEELKARFPKMTMHKLGLVTLFTDTEGPSLKTLKSAVRDQMSVVYLEFLDLMKDRKPDHQVFVVVFDKIQEYYDVASLDGVPAFLCPGYFKPEAKTLFMMNYMGDEFTGRVYLSLTGVRKVLNKINQRAEGNRHQIQIEGATKEFEMRLERMLAYLQTFYTNETLVTLRHEMTHAFFHHFGLQTVKVSQAKDPDEATKKSLLGAEDQQGQKKFLLSLLDSKKQKDEEVGAANSWFVEGTAEYASTSAAGIRNTDRIYNAKEALKKNELWPVEQLTVFKMGSFPGVCTAAMISAYAQSYSFVDYLMSSHRKGFMKYLNRMSREAPKSGNDDVQWLLEAVGKDSKTLEKGWHSHIQSYENVEDQQMEAYFKVRDILEGGKF